MCKPTVSEEYYIFVNKVECPLCTSSDIEYETEMADFFDEDNALYATCECVDCRSLFRIGFKVSSVEILGNDDSFKL